MCGRFVAAYDADRLADDWDARASSSLPPVSWNVAPNAPIRVLAPDRHGALWLTAAFWSLIPEWMRDEVPSFPTFNARIETALERPAFRDAARNHRLIVPMTAYYEWDEDKRPYCFTARDGGCPVGGGTVLRTARGWCATLVMHHPDARRGRRGGPRA
ncbi:SOS response-associated peptidase family protein [Bifidobacterium pullorum subsp. saeculare]|uniref:SOS response-associated peptidase n=1 Tax=Bifidobacterium pullorum TaxID=78448 RepID=UPI0019576DEB|nr:SOS response-associated peptidase family protein [Bifidobacterium pullorum subsp. saeculare]